MKWCRSDAHTAVVHCCNSKHTQRAAVTKPPAHTPEWFSWGTSHSSKCGAAIHASNCVNTLTTIENTSRLQKQILHFQRQRCKPCFYVCSQTPCKHGSDKQRQPCAPGDLAKPMDNQTRATFSSLPGILPENLSCCAVHAHCLSSVHAFRSACIMQQI